MIKTIALFETDIQAYAQLGSRRIGAVCIYTRSQSVDGNS